MLGARMTAQRKKGWRVHQVFEQDGNTVVVYEREVAGWIPHPLMLRSSSMSHDRFVW